MKKAISKITAVIAICSLMLSIVNPLIVFADELTPAPQPSNTPTPEITLTPTPTLEPTLTLTPALEQTPTSTPSLTPNVTPNSTPEPEWQTNQDNSSTTTNNVEVNHFYVAPQNNKVAIKFTKLPDVKGKLTVKEVKLTSEQIQQTDALSDTAYDISSTMTDGTFEYILTLPTSKTENVEVKSSEDGKNFVTVGEVSAQTDTLTITGLNHFTIFVIAGTITTPGPGSFIGEPFDESSASAVINEFLYNPPSGQSEWIEILNKTENDIDLSGWTVSDTAGHTEDLSGTLPASGLMVYINTGSGWLNNTTSSGNGDTIYLKNGSTLVDKVTYQQETNGTVIDNTSDVGTVSSGNSVARTSDGGSSWATGSPTKGWFNRVGGEGAAPLLSDIDSQLDLAGITSNIGELDNPSNTPEGDSGLYFEVAGEGKIIFTANLNLTSQATVAILQSLGQKMEMTDGHLEFDSQTASDMTVTGAKLYMYGINNLGYSSENQPSVIVSDDIGNEIPEGDENYPIVSGSLVYDPDINEGQIVFDASHFTQFDVPDTTGPEIANISIDPVVDFDYLKKTVTVSASVTDNSGVSSVQFGLYDYYGLGEEPETSCEGGLGENGLWSCSIDTTSLSEELSYYLQVTAYDSAGNSSSDTYYNDWGDELYVDNTAPQTSDSGTDSDWQTSDVTVTFDCSDDSSGCSNTYYTTDGSDPTTSSLTGNEITLTDDGQYTIKYFSDDNAGNQESIKTAANIVKIDKTAPSGLGTPSTSPNPTNSTAQIWTWSAATDALSDIAQYIWGVGELGGSTTNTSVTTNLLEGIWNFSVKSQDNAGNQSEEVSNEVTVDTTTPSVTKFGTNSSDYTIATLAAVNLIFSEALDTTSKTAVQNALTGGADKTITYSWNDDNKTLTITGNASGVTTFSNDVVVDGAKDLAGNIADELLLVDSKTESTQTVPAADGAATVNSTTPEVVVTSPTQAVTVTISSETDNPSVNYDSLITSGTGTIPETTINSDKANIKIPASTTVTSADTNWDGVIAAPTVTTVTLPAVSGETKTLSTAIEVGFTGAKLSFDKAVRILLPNQAGKRVGYIRTGIDFTEITSTCSADNQTTGNALAADGDCKIDVGSDLVIWTKHFTKFATYTQTATSTTTSSSTSSGGGGSGNGDGKSDGLGCASHDCSGGSAASPQSEVLGAITQIAEAAGFTQEFLGETTTTPTPSQKEVLGAKENPTPTPKLILAQSTSSKIIIGLIILILASGFGFWIFKKRSV